MADKPKVPQCAVYDFSNPAAPTLVAWYKTSAEADTAALTNANWWAIDGHHVRSKHAPHTH